LYKSLRDKGQAVRHFTIALNLDPKICLIVLIILDVTDNQIRLASRSKKRSRVLGKKKMTMKRVWWHELSPHPDPPLG
jgi:hypothetical protein